MVVAAGATQAQMNHRCCLKNCLLRPPAHRPGTRVGLHVALWLVARLRRTAFSHVFATSWGAAANHPLFT